MAWTVSSSAVQAIQKQIEKTTMPPTPSKECDRHEAWLKNHEDRIRNSETLCAIQERLTDAVTNRQQDHEDRLRIVEAGNLRLLSYASIAFLILSLVAQYVLKHV